MAKEHRATPARLREFFNPKSIALVGASDRNDMSLQVHLNLQRNGYEGQLYYVNPKSDRVHGQPTVSNLTDIAAEVDLAFVFIGGDRVIDVAEEAGAKGIRNLVILSGGYGETGAEGHDREARLVAVAERYDQLILGPNTIGYINTHGNVALYGSASAVPIKRGPVGVAVQSGVLLALSVAALPLRGAGLSTLAAVANEAVISLDAMIDYFVEDPDTKVIALFMETTRDPVAFRRVALRALEAGKPIVALAGARTAVTVGTAVSHTGALVGDNGVRMAALAELGVIAVHSLEELFATAALVANYGPLTGRRTAFTSVSGGLCEIFADRAVEVGLEMPDFAPDTKSKLAELLPSFGTARNPLDYTGVGQTDLQLLPNVLRVLSQDPNLDHVVFGDWLVPGEPADPSAVVAAAETLADVSRNSPIPVLAASSTFTDPHPYNAELAEATGRPAEIGGSEHGPLAMERSIWWSERRRAHLEEMVHMPRETAIPISVEEVGTAWSEHRSLGLLSEGGVPVVPNVLATSEDAAAKAASSIGYPVAVKVCSPDIPHKSRIGAVVLNVEDEPAARAAYAAVLEAAAKAAPGAAIEGVLLMPMRAPSLELIAGVIRDPTWGPVLAVGMGGVWAEIIKDTQVALLPTTAARVETLLRRLRAAALLAGGHGYPPADFRALAGTIVDFSQVALSLGDGLESFEVNPIRVDGANIEALDGLITWRIAADS